MDTRKLKDKASQAFSKGNFEKAAELYEELVKVEPKELQLKVRLGDTYIRCKRIPEAVKNYREVVDRYARDGLLLKSIAVCKIILEVDPAHADTQTLLADLYARKYGRPPEPSRAAAAGPGPARPIQLQNVAAAEPAPIPLPNPIPLSSPVPLVNVAAAPRPEPSSMGFDIDLSGNDELPAELAGGDGSTSIEQMIRDAEASLDARPQAPRPPGPHVPAVAQPAAAPRRSPPPPPAAARAEAPAAAAPRASPPPPPAAARAEPVAAPRASPPPAPAADDAGLSLEDRLDEVAPIGMEERLTFDEGARSRSSIEIDAGTLSGLVTPGGEDEEIELLTVSAEAGGIVDAEELPQIPLFSELGKAAFVQLLETCNLKRLEPDDAAIVADEKGDSFFVVVSGKVKVVQINELGDEIVLASLGEGAFFGEMALLSGAPRIASVIATEPTELLEFTAKTLGALVRDHPSVQNVLRKFYRQRLLANVMATSPIFRPFDRNDRKSLVEKFKARDVERGEALIEEESQVDGLYVILTGEVSVTKKDKSKKVTLATLKEGDIFGEMSLLTRAKATASCTAKRRGTVLRLPKKSFDELILTHPQVLEMVAELSEERKHRTDAILEGKLACDEEGLVLV